MLFLWSSLLFVLLHVSGLDAMPTTMSRSQGDLQIYVKCFFFRHNAKNTVGQSWTMTWNSFKWARAPNGRWLKFTGRYQTGNDLFELTGWNHDLALSPSTLASVCQDTFKHGWTTKDVHFAYARAGCPDLGEGGDLYRCDHWQNAAGPYLSFHKSLLSNQAQDNTDTIRSWVTFGDSLSSQGDHYLWSNFGLPGAPYYKGYFTNGQNWQEYLSYALFHDYGDGGASSTYTFNPQLPASGYTSLAVGGAATNVDYYPSSEHTDGLSTLDKIMVGAQSEILSDVWQQLEYHDSWLRKVEDPTAITLSQKCSAYQQCNAPHSSCVGTRCKKEDGTDCDIFSCVCDKGFASHGNKCVPMPHLNQPVPDPVYVLWIGPNDIFKAVGSDIVNFVTNNTGYYGYTRIVQRSIGEVEKFLEGLYVRGARKLMVPNMPDLGVIPANLKVSGAFTDYPSHTPGFETDAFDPATYYYSLANSRIAQLFNKELRQALDRFEAAHPDVELVAPDIFGFFERAFESKIETPAGHIEDYAFDLDLDEYQLLEGPQGDIRVYEQCFANEAHDILGYGPFETRLCDNEDRAIFWDDAHPTTRVHCYMAYYFHLSLYKKKLASAPDLEAYTRMCSSTKPWLGLGEE